MIEYMRELRGRGYRMAICTNNIREWEAQWRAMLPVDEIFDVVVDSAFVGSRKPEPRIYEITLERLGASRRGDVFIDDVEVNCDGARQLGITAIRFRSTEQAIEEIEAALARDSTVSPLAGDHRDRVAARSSRSTPTGGCANGTPAPPSCSGTRARRRSGPSWPS